MKVKFHILTLKKSIIAHEKLIEKLQDPKFHKHIETVEATVMQGDGVEKDIGKIIDMVKSVGICLNILSDGIDECIALDDKIEEKFKSRIISLN